MISGEGVIVIVVGIVFATAGIILFAFFTYLRLKHPPEAETEVKPGRTELKVGRFFDLKTSSPSLVIFVVGVAMILAPFTFLTEQPAQSFSFAENLGDEVPDTGPSSYASFVTVYDDTHTIQVEVPNEWSDTLGVPWSFHGEIVGPAISASADLESFRSTWSTPGVFFGASSTLTATEDVDSLLDSADLSAHCVYEGRSDYADVAYTGKFDLWSDCGRVGTVFLVITAVPSDGSFITYVEIQVVSQADLDALDRIIDTFFVLEGFEERWGP